MQFVDQYRRLAEEAEQIAARAISDVERRAEQRLAKAWRQLAELRLTVLDRRDLH